MQQAETKRFVADESCARFEADMLRAREETRRFKAIPGESHGADLRGGDGSCPVGDVTGGGATQFVPQV
eukprot:663461-Pyramimonas_sp.AAC.1